VVASGGLNDSLQGRFSIHRNRSDGYITNKFLNRENTNNVDEIGSRVKLRWLASEDTTVDITGIYIDAANGYDAFSLDHSRHTRSDEPGRDYQRSRALSVKATWDQFDSYLLETQVTYEQTELEYGFDWDWSDMATVGVRGFENNVRDRNAHSADLRILSKAGSEVLGGASWVAGIKAYSRKVELSYTEDADYYGAWTGALDSIYRTSRYAVYTQFDWSLTERLALSLGSRLEHFDNDYLDSYGVKGDIADDLLGGKLSLQYQLHDNTMLYGLISSGYKTGGINTDAFGKALVSGDAQTIDLLTQKLTYSDETLLNYELGLKGSYLQDKLQLNLNAFYLDRQNMQAKLALEISSGNWTSYRDNTRGSHSYGVELQSAWQLLPELKLSASLGLLESELGDLVILDIDDIPQSQKGRDQAHAPQYQFNVGIDYQFLDNFSLNIQIDGKDSFYFSNSHNQKSTGYELVHGKLSYQNGPLTVALWGRNLTDQDYQVRGFYFANNPNNGWLAESYTQLGEPRVFGISGQYDF
jgi:outer membrane receptor protein involved in Fe transport